MKKPREKRGRVDGWIGLFPAPGLGLWILSALMYICPADRPRFPGRLWAFLASNQAGAAPPFCHHFAVDKDPFGA